MFKNELTERVSAFLAEDMLDSLVKLNFDKEWLESDEGKKLGKDAYESMQTGYCKIGRKRIDTHDVMMDLEEFVCYFDKLDIFLYDINWLLLNGEADKAKEVNEKLIYLCWFNYLNEVLK